MIISTPGLITHALERAQSGEWLPQALQSRKETLTKSLKQLERQQELLLEVYLGEVIEREEFQRKRRELSDTQNALHRQLRQLEAQVQKQLDVAELASGIGDFCEHIQQTLPTLTFQQRRELVTLLIDRVVVDDEKVEIRYVIPTSPAGEEKPFCHLRSDYQALLNHTNPLPLALITQRSRRLSLLRSHSNILSHLCSHLFIKR